MIVKAREELASAGLDQKLVRFRFQALSERCDPPGPAADVAELARYPGTLD